MTGRDAGRGLWTRLSVLAALLLPLLVLCAMTVRAEWQRRSGTLVRVSITGYDPRDPLRGHYLVYRIDWKWQSGAKLGPKDEALCVTESGDDPPVRPIAVFEDPGDCPLVIRRDLSDPGQFRPVGLSGQLFVDERQAATLERALQSGGHKLSLELAVRADGTARIRDWRAADTVFRAETGP